MYKVFLVTDGLSIVEDIPPTSSVLSLQTSLSRKCGVRTKDVILLSPKGHLLDSKETLGAYDAGTDEKPVFVFLRPSSDHTNKKSSLYTPYKVNPALGPKLDRLTSSPSPTALQHQLVLGELLAEEALKVSNKIQELRVTTRLQCMGWQALTNNFTSIHRVFEKHHRAFGWSLSNLRESRSSYEELLAKSPHQLETLKRIHLAPSIAQGVFDGHNQTSSLYDWISSQDEHSSLPDLIRECKDALNQINETSLSQLHSTASQFIAAADNLAKSDSVKELLNDIKMEEVIKTNQEQQSMAQSLQSTIRRVLGSGDAGALANVSLSNQRLIQLMHNNHRVLETKLQELEMTRVAISEKVESGLKTVAELQQQMIESNTQLLFHSEHLQLTRRRFEVLEQICASPQTLSHILFEVEQRKRFKKEYTEFAQNMANKLDTFRHNEKLRRQKFLEAYSQHFLLSLFPSFTDRVPHFINMSNQSFDDELCHLSDEMIVEMSQWLPKLATPPSRSVSLHRDDTCQTETLQLDKPVLYVTKHEHVGVQCSPDVCESSSQMEDIQTQNMSAQTPAVNRTDAECQTALKKADASIQTLKALMAEVGLQVKLKFGEDVLTQTDSTPATNSSSQTTFTGEDNSVQTVAPSVADIGVQIAVNTGGVDSSSQTTFTGENNSVQTVAPSVADVGVQIAVNTGGVDNSSQTTASNCIHAHVQTAPQLDQLPDDGATTVHAGSQTATTGSQNIVIDTGSQTFLVQSLDNYAQTLQTELSETSSQTTSQLTAGIDTYSQTDRHGNTNIGSQTEYNSNSNYTQTTAPDRLATGSQTHFIGQNQQSQTLSPNLTTASSQTERNVIDNDLETGLDPLFLRQSSSESTYWPVKSPSYSDSTVVLESGSQVTETEPNTIPTNSMTSLEGQVVALNAAVSGLKAQLVSERELHKKQMMGMEKRVQLSVGRDAEEINSSLTVTIGSLRVGDTALFFQDGHLNFLALTVDGRIYYLNHTSAETFKHDISSKILVPLKRKVLIGVITEKLLVEVRKESNRLKVPIGQRLYKLSAREAPLT